MSWYKTIERFLNNSESKEMEIGERTQHWIKSFDKDLERWEFPVFLYVKKYKADTDRFLVTLYKEEIDQK